MNITKSMLNQNSNWSNSWQDYYDRAVKNVGYRGLATALGLKIAGGSANAKLRCCSPFRKDKNPSAVIFGDTGRYHDSGASDDDKNVPKNLSFVELIARLRNIDSDRGVLEWMGEVAGLPPLEEPDEVLVADAEVAFDEIAPAADRAPELEPAPAAEFQSAASSPEWNQLEELPWPDAQQYVELFLKQRPGLTEEAMLAFGADVAMWSPDAHRNLAASGIPVFMFNTFDRLDDDPTGALLVRADGEPFRSGDSRAMLLKGSKNGWIAPVDMSALQSCDLVLWVESWSDALAAYPHLPKRAVVLCSSCGATSVPRDLSVLDGKNVVLIGDADQAGQAGVNKKAKAATRVAARVSIAMLPYDVTQKHGKDVRDYVVEKNDLLELLDGAVLHYADSPGLASTSDIFAVIEPPAGVTEGASDPDRLAREIRRAWIKGIGQVVQYRDESYVYDGCCYRLMVPKAFPINLHSQLKAVVDRESASTGREAQKVTRSLTSDVINAILAATPKLPDVSTPFMISSSAEVAEPDVLAYHTVKNGIVVVRDDHCELLDHTPQMFATSNVSYDFEESATCPRWHQFLEETLGDQPDAVQTLQQWFGLCLTRITKFQKLLLIVGPPRSGKGTIARILEMLIGPDSYVAASAGGLQGQFGFEGFFNARVACFGDVRLDSKKDASKLSEVILNITGEDVVSVERKWLRVVSKRLPVKLMWLSNEVPRIADVTTAVANRFEPIHFKKSLADRVDPNLEEKLLRELPGILLWALEGLYAYQAGDGSLVRNERGRQLVEEMEIANSPISRFVADRCQLDPSYRVRTNELLSAFNKWADSNNEGRLNDSTFGQLLQAAQIGVKNKQANDPRLGRRVRMYFGIRLR